MAEYVLWSAAVWTFKSLLCTWRFFWVSPYYTIKSAPWTHQAADSDQKPQSKLNTVAHDVKHHGGTDVNADSGKKARPEKRVHRGRTSALHKRLLTAEGEIQDLKAEIANQRASWEMRFIELQRRQHDLREQNEWGLKLSSFKKDSSTSVAYALYFKPAEVIQQLSPRNRLKLKSLFTDNLQRAVYPRTAATRSLNSEILVRSGMLYRDTDSEELDEVFTESGLENGFDCEEKELKCFSGLRQIHQQKGSDLGLFRDDVDQNSLCGSQMSCPLALGSRTTSFMSNTSVRSWRSGGPHRVFVPHSPLDLKIGHRVRIMLPSGRTSTGTLRYLGCMQNSPDFYLGVELELADNGQYDGTYEGQRYFDCQPGHGAFIAFSKLLMAWE
ncbi:uncharacterized protein LOC127658320 isoform X1 [Xyrauchen texanus]|uniref:uncharacterized protein LOC127658320 isoform X1 n=1 Tax=Xyrauchen texanus TaxID=154827 RepID=UPI0022425054|nr:uncharacterized protein LOC127658320 isoform X1 [Xyrauchen texanus]XP_052003511.1 uncharacterized protein LOC127658320 isoform X1 [Xyrauchen texanus]